MQLITLFLFALPVLLARTIRYNRSSPKGTVIYNKRAQGNKGLLKSNLLINSATSQLVILQPNSSTPLAANTTAPLLIGAQPVSKAMRDDPLPPVEVVTKFICDGVVKAVINSTLGVPTDFILDPNASGNCIIETTAPGNSTLFLPSEPVMVVVLVPIYYEGAVDSVLYTGQVINNYLRASDNSLVPVTLRINCTSGSQVDLEYLTNRNNFYSLPSQLTGVCTFWTPVVPQYYIPIEPFNVTIEPTIKFTQPTQGQTYTSGSSIIAQLVASNNLNPDVTVQLTCEGTEIESLTQPVQSNFVFTPKPKMYGNCILSIVPIDPYYTEDTVEVRILNSLSFKSPSSGDIIAVGSNYTILVDGTSGNSILNATVVGSCAVGGTFTYTVVLGEALQVIMDESFRGQCVLTATVTVPYFTPATVTVFAYEEVQPDEVSKIAKRLTLKGQIFSLTSPNILAGQA